MKYTASRLSDGNKIFPAEIHVQENGIEVKIPGFLGGKTTYLAYSDISGVTVDTPLIGFSSIRFHAKGGKVFAHGFNSSDVKQIKTIIENGRSNKSNRLRTPSVEYDIESEDQIVAVKTKRVIKKQAQQSEEKLELLDFEYSDNSNEIQKRLDDLILELKASKWDFGNNDEVIANNKKLNKILAKYELGFRKLKFNEKNFEIIKIYHNEFKSLKLKKFLNINGVVLILGGVVVLVCLIGLLFG